MRTHAKHGRVQRQSVHGDASENPACSPDAVARCPVLVLLETLTEMVSVERGEVQLAGEESHCVSQEGKDSISADDVLPVYRQHEPSIGTVPTGGATATAQNIKSAASSEEASPSSGRDHCTQAQVPAQEWWRPTSAEPSVVPGLGGNRRIPEAD